MLEEIAARVVPTGGRKVDKPLVLYGAGNLGRMAKAYFSFLGIPVTLVLDIQPGIHRASSFWAGTEICHPRDVPPSTRQSSLLVVCVANSPFNGIAAPLRVQGWEDIAPFYDVSEAYTDSHPLSNGWFTGNLDPTDLAGITACFSRWEDTVSRAHHLQFIAWHALREEWSFDDAPVSTDDRYFIPEILKEMHGNETFVDAGAHHGEVVTRFLQLVGNNFRSVFAIEPDPENLNRLRAQFEAFPLEVSQRMTVLDNALGAEETVRPFHAGLDYASQFSTQGLAATQVRRMDDLSIPATFLKLHLEGWEQDAIRGALQTICRQRPMIAVAAYHKRSGLWALPSQIMTSLDSYAFYFRLHSWQGTGAVVYAIPREQRK